MFNLRLFLLLIAVSLPGILVVVPGTLRVVRERLARSAGPDQALPSQTVLILASTLQTMLIVALMSAAGTLAAPRVGLRAPFFEALVAGEDAWAAIQPQLLPALLLGLGGGALFVAAYYVAVRPHLDRLSLIRTEGLRIQLGLVGRLLYGGIVEEIITRWGLMSLVSWGLSLLLGTGNPLTFWGAIVLSGILFGLGHLPSYLGAGAQPSPLLIGFSLTFNLWASLIFGWLFWQYGLEAAMLAHMLLHLLWYPFDVRSYRQLAEVSPLEGA